MNEAVIRITVDGKRINVTNLVATGVTFNGQNVSMIHYTGHGDNLYEWMSDGYHVELDLPLNESFDSEHAIWNIIEN